MAPIATLTVKLGAQIAEFQSEFRDAAKAAQKFQDDFQGVATKASAVGSFFGTIAADIAKSLARGFGDAIRDAVRFSSEFHNAFIGLSSVARAFGADTDTATAAARKLSSDGLLPLKDSATGLKNLLAAGFNLDQSVKLMDAFKDSAAFGRQGALSFGDAVRSATEGVKNGNSILVDNAGVTKNLSQILKEAGFSAQDLSRASSDAGVRMALFKGILQETAAQTGDAAKLTQTYTGQVTRLESQYHTFLASLGDAITQNKDVAIAIGFVGDAVLNLTKFLGENRRGFNLVSDGVILFAKALSTAMDVADLLQTTFTALQLVFNTTARAILNIGITVLELGQKAATLQKYLDPLFAKQHANEAREIGDAIQHMKGMVEGLTKASIDSADRSDRWGNAIQTARVRVDDLAKQLEASRGDTVKFAEAIETVHRRTGPAGDSLDQFGKKARAAAEDVGKGVSAILKDIGSVAEKVEKLAEPFDRAFEHLRDRINGVELVEQAQLWVAALQETGAQAKVLADEHLRKELGEIISQLTGKFGSLEAAGVGSLNAIATAMGEIIKLPDIGLKLGLSGKQLPGTQLPKPTGAITPDTSPLLAQLADATALGGSFMDAFIQAVQQSGTSATTAARAAATSVATSYVTTFAQYLTGKAKDGGLAITGFVGDSIKAGLSALNALIGGGPGGLLANLKGLATGISTEFVSTLLSVIPGIGPALSQLASPIVDGVKKLFGSLFGTAGRTTVTSFVAKEFGGSFDALHAKLNELGAAGEQLWIKLTQGVGRNNSAEAQAAIEAVTAALAKHKAAQEKVADAAIAAGNAQAEATRKAQDAIDALTGQITSLQKSIENEAPEEVMGIIEANTRAQIAAIEDQRTAAQAALDDTVMNAAQAADDAGNIIDEALRDREFRIRVKVDLDGLPNGVTAVPGFQHGTRGRYMNFGGGTLAMLHGRERVVTEHEPIGDGGGGDFTFVLDAGQLWDERVVKVARKDAARGGTRPRAPHGRSY